MSGAVRPVLTLRTPPRFGRRAVWSTLAALGLYGLSYFIDAAEENQLGPSGTPGRWTRYCAYVALYYAAICAFRWLRRRHRRRRVIVHAAKGALKHES